MKCDHITNLKDVAIIQKSQTRCFSLFALAMGLTVSGNLQNNCSNQCIDIL